MAMDGQLETLCDDKGFLARVDQWSTDIAHRFAKIEGIALTDPHWEILHLLRKFHEQFGDSPANRALVNFVREHLGKEKGIASISCNYFPALPHELAAVLRVCPSPKTACKSSMTLFAYEPEQY